MQKLATKILIDRNHYEHINDYCKGKLGYKKTVAISKLLINMFKYSSDLRLAQNAAITPNIIYT